jgi:hypothetical protein
MGRRESFLIVLIVGPKLFIEPGTKGLFPAFERERPRIVNNFAASASSGLRIVVHFREDEFDETFEPGGCAWVGQRILR